MQAASGPARGGRQGFALVLVLGIMLLLAVVSLTLNQRSALQQRMTSNRTRIQQGVLARKAAIEYALLRLRSFADWRTVPAGEPFVFAGITNTIIVRDSTIAGYTNVITIAAFQQGGTQASRVSVRMEPNVSSIFIADTGNHCIRRIDMSTGDITTVAGTGVAGYTGDGGPAGAAALSAPAAVCLTEDGAVVIADTGNNAIRRIDPTNQVITTIAHPTAPTSVWEDSAGRIFYSDNHMSIKRIAGGVISTVAGCGVSGYGGDGGQASSACLADPMGLFKDQGGTLLLADSGNSRIRKVDANTGIIVTIAGNGSGGYSGDGGPATNASIRQAQGACADALGNVYIADAFNHAIRRVSAATGIITTVAGLGYNGYWGDGGPGNLAALTLPGSVSVGADGNVYLADTGNHCIRKLDLTTGLIDTIAGQGAISGYAGDGGPASDALLNAPSGVCADELAPQFTFVSELY